MEIRVRLRPWLECRLNEGWIDGLSWIDKEKGIFKIPWKHHSKHTWAERDAAIFKDWAVVTGRFRTGVDDPDWPMWKTRLRCALNKAPDIQEVRQRHQLHCDEPFKVYRFISKTESLWRANATRNASLIFDGFSAVNKMGFTNFPTLSRLDYSQVPQNLTGRTAIVVQRIPSMDWAVVTGRFRTGVDDPDWPMWKTRLRCALNKAPDIQEVRQRHQLHCDEPFKVYRFISKTESLWRANATRNASLIFDGFSAVNKMGFTNFPTLSRLDYSQVPQNLTGRTAIVVQRIPSMDWAVVTGRFRTGVDDPDWPMWKTRLRCALNKAPDIQEVRQRHQLHCDEPFKVYRFISKTESLWRANATRNASLIFDGFSAVNKMGFTNFPTLSRLDYSQVPQNLTGRTAIVVQRIPSMVHRRAGTFCVKRMPIIQSMSSVGSTTYQPYDSLTTGATPPSGLFRLANDSYDASNLYAASSRHTDTIASSTATTTNGAILHRLDPSGTLRLPNALLPDIVEPEYHQLGVRIQHLNVRVKDAIITNPNGCCIYFGRYDEINSPAAPDPVEAQIPHHISEANKEYVDLLLDNMIRGIALSVVNGSIYAQRMCKCAVFVYIPTLNGEYVLLKKLGRRQQEPIFNYEQFMSDLRYHRMAQHPRPHFEVILAFGQQLRPNAGTSSLLVWSRVASCRAWFQLHKGRSPSSSHTDFCGTDLAPDSELTNLSDGPIDQYDPMHPHHSELISNLNCPTLNDACYHLPVATNGKSSDLDDDDEDRLSDDVRDAAAVVRSLNDSLAPDMTNVEEQVIEEAVEVPLDDQAESVIYTNPPSDNTASSEECSSGMPSLFIRSAGRVSVHKI